MNGWTPIDIINFWGRPERNSAQVVRELSSKSSYSTILEDKVIVKWCLEFSAFSYKEMIDKFNAEYIAGGAAQNTARVAQVIPLHVPYTYVHANT